MVNNISKNNGTSSSLKDIVNMFDEYNRRPPDIFSISQNFIEPNYEAYDNNDFDGDLHDNSGNWDFVDDNKNRDGTYDREEEPFTSNQQEQYEQYVSLDPGVDDRFVRVEDFLFSRLGLTARQNAIGSIRRLKKIPPRKMDQQCCPKNQARTI